MQCNICGETEFLDQGLRKRVRCANCGSLERTRMLWLHLSSIEIRPTDRVLHIAPERGLYEKLARIVPPANYVTADLFPELFKFAPDCREIDLCALDHWPSDTYDLIIHSHVLEHVPCTLAYPLFHLHRMLRQNGKHVFVVPMMKGEYAENFQRISDEERVRTLTQADHMRRFGSEDVDRHLGALLDLRVTFDAEATFGAAALEAANIPRRNWHGMNGATVFVLSRADMKFIGRI